MSDLSFFDIDEAISAAEKATMQYGHELNHETDVWSHTQDQLEMLGFGIEAAAPIIASRVLRDAAKALRDEAAGLPEDDAIWLLSAASTLRHRASALEVTA